MSVHSRAAPVARCVAQGLLLAAGAAGATGAFAQTRWIQSLVVPMEIEHDSNPTMATVPAGSTNWLRLTPSLTTRYVLDANEFGVDMGLTLEKSSNQEVAKDRADPRLRAFWKHADPLNTTELALVYDRSALRDAGLTEQVQLGVDGSRTLYGIHGTWKRDLDARTALSTDLSQEWERYSGTTTPDFSRTTAAVRYARARNERQTWYATLNGQAYRSEAGAATVPDPTPAQRSTVVGALAGVDHEFSEALRVDAAAGPVHFLQPSSSTGWQGAVKAGYTAERWFAGLELSRTPVVNATFGGLVLADQLQLRFRYDLDPLTRVDVEAGHARESAARSQRTLASAAWTRQWSESWQVSLKASTQRQQGPEGTARSNRIGVVFTYTAADL
ncbi:MAG: hypothetical protein K0S48_264 [Ramlibacter sp.]|nr:hypothetical protein [Ramlibacter sp.]